MTRLFLGLLSLLLLATMLHAEPKPLSLTEGTKLKNLKQYRLRDFHLKKRVRYFDLRQYYTTKGYPYMRGWAFDQQAYNKLPSNLRNILQRLDAEKARNKKGWDWFSPKNDATDTSSDFRRYGQPYRKTISILYFAKMDNRTYIYHANSEKWMKDFLGEIDRPAELALILHAHRGTKRYKKIPQGYLVRIDNLIKEKNAPDGRCMYVAIQIIVNKHGELERLYKGNIDEGPFDKQKCDSLRKKIGSK